MTLSNVYAAYGLVATGTPTGTNIGGNVTIGAARARQNITGADIAYSFKITSTGAGNQANLDLETGVVSDSVGTPTKTDGDGKDFEGVTLPTMVTLYAVLAEAITVPSSYVAVTSGGLFSTRMEAAGESGLWVRSGGLAVSGLVLSTYCDVSGAVVEVTVIGKSS